MFLNHFLQIFRRQVLRVDRHRLTVRKCRSPERAPEDPRSGGAPNWWVVVVSLKPKKTCV